MKNDEVIMPKVAEPGIHSKDMIVGHSDGFEWGKPIVNTVDLRGVQVQEKPKVAMRFDSNKLRLDLIPPEFLIELARVYTMGALKYDDDNWRKGMPWRKVYRPIWSHLIKWLSGHTIDSETGCHHLAMVAWNCATLFMYQLHKLGTDDRFKFDIDENFNWVHNHLEIGLDDSKITELKNKYNQQRENAK